MRKKLSRSTQAHARQPEGRRAPKGVAAAKATSSPKRLSAAATSGAAKGPRQDTSALRAFLTSSAAALAALTAILALEIVYEHVEWPLVRTEYVEIATILALMSAFGIFALGRWRELVRERAERARAEEELRKLSRAVEQSPASVVITDTNGDIEYVNPKFTQVTGYTSEEVAGKNPRILKSGETPPELYSQLWHTITSGGEWRGEFRNKKKNGELYWVSASISPVRNSEDDITHFLAINEDITERKRAEEELIRAREQAEAATRAKSEFVANMSHEIRTPMNGVIGAIELLLDTGLQGEQQDLAATAKLSADALLAIINDILDFSEMEASKLSVESVDFNLAGAVREVVDLLAPRAREKGLEIACSIPRELPALVKGDPVRVRHVLTNLVDNAIKFTEEGEVRVKVAITEEASRHVTARISVRDTGIGVPGDRQTAIFESFVQADGSTRRKFGGSGLGLAICHRLVELMGGELGLESRVGQGSTFWFQLTLEKSAPVGAEQSRLSENTGGLLVPDFAGGPVPATRTEEIPKRRLRVLVAEDNPVNRKVALKLVEREGHSADAAADGLQALELVVGNRFDVVLMDVQMPEMDGFEATARIRRREIETGDHVPIIAMTAHAMEGDRERCLSHGMDDYISKPVTSEKLSSVLSRWASGTEGPHPRKRPRAEAAPPLVDLGQIRKISAEDDEFALELIREFLAHTPGLIAELREAISRNEAHAAERLAHNVKGSCRVLGAGATAGACEALEGLLGSGQWADVDSALVEVEQQYAHLSEHLQSWLKAGVI